MVELYQLRSWTITIVHLEIGEVEGTSIDRVPCGKLTQLWKITMFSG